MRTNDRDPEKESIATTNSGANDDTMTTVHMKISPVDSGSMKLIPWGDIWSSLRLARLRGNGEMIEVFYDTLFKEAVFDDNGAWSIDLTKKN